MLDTSLDSSNFYFLLAVFQGLVLSVLIIVRGKWKKPDFFLGLLIFLFSLSLLHMILEESIPGFNGKFPIPMDFALAYGPLAYLHILQIKNPLRKFAKKDLLHFLPSLIIDGFFFFLSRSYIGANRDWANNNQELILTMAVIIIAAGCIQLMIYTFLIYNEAGDTKQVLREFESVKKWLNYLLGSWYILIMFQVLLVPLVLISVNHFEENKHLFYIPMGAITGLLIFVLGYSYLLKFSPMIGTYMEKVKNFDFTNEDLAGKKMFVLQTIEKDELYKDPKITLAKLAGHLNWPINSLSIILNQVMKTSFSDLINGYRVECFKKLVLTPKGSKYSISGLGMEAGFSSKASFYRAFKKETGMTPTQFISSIASEESQMSI